MSGWTAAGLYAALTLLFTWPQIVRLFSVPAFMDTYFSMWRIAWIAHQLPRDPLHLFDTNIFFPVRHTLAYSDAVLLQGALGAPLHWLGLPTVFVYNLLILAGFVLSALGAFLLVRDLTRSGAAAFVAGMVFAFAPFRFDHYVHLELVWAQSIPFALWMLHRTIRRGRISDGIWTGVFVALQGFSCVYYTVFLATVLVIVGPVALTTASRRVRARAMVALLAGAMVAGVLLAPYIAVYNAARADVGQREREVTMLSYSVGPKHYFAAMPESVLYGKATASISVHEKRLFVGFAVMALMVVGLWPPWDRVRLAYALAMVVAIDISFAQRGLLLGWLYDHVVLYRGLRVPGRIGQLVLMSAAVLAGAGMARVITWLRARRPRWTAKAPAVIAGVIAAEYLMFPLTLVPAATVPSESSRWLLSQPPALTLMLPLPPHPNLGEPEPFYEFESTFHWRPMINGYSGHYPASYVENVIAMGDFPSERAMVRVRDAGVLYVLLHERFYGAERYRQVVAAADARPDLTLMGTFADGEFQTRAYRVRASTARGSER